MLEIRFSELNLTPFSKHGYLKVGSFKNGYFSRMLEIKFSELNLTPFSKHGYLKVGSFKNDYFSCFTKYASIDN